MKKREVIGVMVTYHKPMFRQVVVSAEMDGEKINRTVTVCLVEQQGNDGGYMNTIGVSILNPDDKENDLGRTIAEGRALKRPLTKMMTISMTRLPNAVREEIMTWATKYCETNLEKLIKESRGIIK